ncbi:hypothetical protein BLNAU_14653 [Blattamonas nauphoetae]|uniref:Transcription initiation factor IIA gamma subunit N-terminal domain-containing protein n=1 Tax=Blattamonas nauphoetae TaxID=2049346 RepID=A0ABQ9XIF4_9EUKA|nr:hypothetical protein BLNAU_14653 [Blattamonas nauphoetae]
MTLRVYRNTELGQALIKTLDELVSRGNINENQKELMLDRFDSSFERQMTKHARQAKSQEVILKGTIMNRNYYNRTFTIDVADFTVNSGTGNQVHLDAIQLFCFDVQYKGATADLIPPRHEQRTREIADNDDENGDLAPRNSVKKRKRSS